ncbi:hypothetical protein ACJJH9_00080 (plasmid) [Microbulbifer sp. DLAB2-AF]|uniref:hypothetical protein n=1 Tax=Microbulbifer sp. DLAB2-AF TaxID=3243395 RepID=UPI0040391DCB
MRTRSYRQLTEEERKIADAIWWVQARDLDDRIFYGENTELHAVQTMTSTGNSIGSWCFACRTASYKPEPFAPTPVCCDSQHKTKLYSQQQAKYLQSTQPLANRFAEEN